MRTAVRYGFHKFYHEAEEQDIYATIFSKYYKILFLLVLAWWYANNTIITEKETSRNLVAMVHKATFNHDI